MSLKMKNFVLKPRSEFVNDPYPAASRLALDAYATRIASTDPKLARGIREWVTAEQAILKYVKKGEPI